MIIWKFDKRHDIHEFMYMVMAGLGSLEARNPREDGKSNYHEMKAWKLANTSNKKACNLNIKKHDTE
jgi:hypothetical protein